MKITYINHSGFLIETRDCYYIFDYYKGELPYLDKEKEVIVFCIIMCLIHEIRLQMYC